MEPSRHRGFTLVELLVVIAVIGILIGLLLPAVQAARESGRRTQCMNNLRQLGLAMEHHSSAHGRYPTNGWGYLWIGDPDRGSGPEQPGGWIYNVLPYLEQENLADLGKGMSPDDKSGVLPSLMCTPLPVLRCPTRATAQLLPSRPTVVPHNAQWPPGDNLAKNDYAVNGGDYYIRPGPGPSTLEQGDSPGYRWPRTTRASGVCYVRSELPPAGVEDGLSQTYMIGEKFVSTLYYDTWDDLGYDQSQYSGTCVDISRWTMATPLRDCDLDYIPPPG